MLTVGSLLNGRYRLKNLIGSGGAAHVYVADDTFLNREVSVKVLRFDVSEDERALKRFHREARAISEVNHENIVQLYDVDSDGVYHYIVMEYIEGMDLKKYLRLHYPLSLLQVIEMMKQIVQAVNYAHRRGIIHRDLKPQNILIRKDGQLKITDFGIATGLNEASMTQTNTLIGSIHYLSPEQTRGYAATQQSDIYALGVIFYELLMGNVPFTGDLPVSIAMKHFQEPIPSVVKYAKQQVPQSVENIILKACAKQPENRYRSAQDMFLAIQRCMDATVQNEPKFVEDINIANTKAIDTPFSQVTDTANAITPQKNKKKKMWLWIWLATLLTIIVGGLLIAFFILTHKEPIIMPDLSNQTQAQATKTLSELGLTVSKVEYVSHDTITKDSVVSTDPAAQTKVEANSSVKLIVSSGKAAKVMKNYVNQTYTKAYEELIALGFIVERVEEISATVPQGQVISQSIPSGTSITTNNTVIRLTVSSGGVTIEDYTGKSYTSVAANLESQGFEVSATDKVSFTATEGTILSQSITKNTKVNPKNTSIHFEVAKAANFVGMTLTDAQSQLSSLNVQVQLKEESSETVAKNTIISQNVTTSNGKTTVTLIVSTGSKQQMVMPNLIGSSKAFAQSQMQQYPVTVVYVTKKSDTHAKGTVSEQSIAAGTTLTANQTVTITISDGQ